MVCFHGSNSGGQQIEMGKSATSSDPCLKLKPAYPIPKNKTGSPALNNSTTITDCSHSRYAMIDLLILIAVVGACGFLLYPYAKILAVTAVEISEEAVEMLMEEIFRAPMVFGCLGLSVFFSVVACVAVTVCVDNRCGKSECRGLHKSAEFDILLETEDSIKKSIGASKSASKVGLLLLPGDHHRELEAELKKMAPPNGRAVLIYRARCGCSVGRMEVHGPRKAQKVKK